MLSELKSMSWRSGLRIRPRMNLGTGVGFNSKTHADIVNVDATGSKQNTHIMATISTGQREEDIESTSPSSQFGHLELAKLAYARGDISPQSKDVRNEAGGAHQTIANAHALDFDKLTVNGLDIRSTYLIGKVDQNEIADFYKFAGAKDEVVTIQFNGFGSQQYVGTALIGRLSLLKADGTVIGTSRGIWGSRDRFFPADDLDDIPLGLINVDVFNSMLLNIKLPDDGDYYVKIEDITEDERGGNYELVVISDTVPVDISESGFQYVAANGGQFAFDYTIDTIDPNYESDPFTISIYASDDGVTPTGSALQSVNVTSSVDLTTGSHSAYISPSFSTPWETHRLIAVIDSADVIDESDETNNVALFSGAFVSQGSLVIHGDDSANSISVTEDGSDFDVVVDSQTVLTIAQSQVTGNIQIYGHGGDDTIDASAIDQALAAWGDGGNDTIDLGSAGDYGYGGIGDDTIDGGGGDDTLAGGDGNDTLYGGAGSDGLYGDYDPGYAGYGDDYLYGGDGDDYLYGEAGNDELHGEDGNDYLDGYAGDDIMYGGYGDDYLSGGDGNDYLEGNDGSDTLEGNDGDDYLVGGYGDDYMYGGYGYDYMEGNDGNDYMEGNDDDDTMYGGYGDDYLDGGPGSDFLDAGGDAGDVEVNA